MCLMHYVISPEFSSCPSSPTAPSFILPSPLPRLILTPPAPSHPLGLSPPATTISEQPKPPASAPFSCRGPELAALQCNARPFMPFYYIIPYLLKARLLQRFHQRRIFPSPLFLYLWLYSRYLFCNLVLETSQGPSYAGDKHPRICHE